MNILLAIIVINIVILTHEFGHYVFAKWHGCGVLEFSIGLGPKIYSFRKQETLFCLRLFPVLGYVSIYGEDDANEKSKDDKDSKDNKEALLIIDKENIHKLVDLPLLKRLSILLGGVFFNIILAILLCYSLVIFKGVPSFDLTIYDTIHNSPAQLAGLKSQDKIIAIQGKRVDSVAQFIQIVNEPINQPIMLTILRNQEIKKISVKSKYDEKQKKRMIGIHFETVLTFNRKGVNSFDYLVGGTRLVWRQTETTFQVLSGLFSRKVALNELSGVVGVVGITSKVIGMGSISTLFLLLSLINVNLAIINALPLPLLDGFACVIALIEGVIRKKISMKIKQALQYAGIIFFAGLFIFITFFDIQRLFFDIWRAK